MKTAPKQKTETDQRRAAQDTEVEQRETGQSVPAVQRTAARETVQSDQMISRVACRIFRERGYHATSMRAIASALSMQPAALYYWYESKEALLYKIMETAVDGLTERVQAAIEPAGAPPRRLEQAITAHIITIADHLDELSVFLHESKALSPRHRDRIQVKRARYEHIFRDILHDGLQSGDFPEIDPRLARFMILAACNWLYNWYKPDGAYRPDEIARAYSDMILNGLRR